ncbi:hypothetical protein T03_10009 [Trichinella britovi]|uniref:Uncharacterized protein n=1 Tax=Trichinella britovi TaxID=45882 RepID=A0A0V1CIT5_TRIBR|nr:hypothetical protein T03_10009 [Trichinella britovi]
MATSSKNFFTSSPFKLSLSPSMNFNGPRRFSLSKCSFSTIPIFPEVLLESTSLVELMPSAVIDDPCREADSSIEFGISTYFSSPETVSDLLIFFEATSTAVINDASSIPFSLLMFCTSFGNTSFNAPCASQSLCSILLPKTSKEGSCFMSVPANWSIDILFNSLILSALCIRIRNLSVIFVRYKDLSVEAE